MCLIYIFISNCSHIHMCKSTNEHLYISKNIHVQYKFSSNQMSISLYWQ